MNYRQRLRARLRNRGMRVQGRLDRLEARVADLEMKPNIFLAPNEWAVRELVEKRITPKAPEGDLRELVIRALNLDASASKAQIVYAVQALNTRSIERGKALLQEEEKARALTDECDALRAENQRLKRIASDPRNVGIPASRSHEFVIREDGSVAHIDVIPFGGHTSWSLRSAAEILVDQEEAKRGKPPLLEQVTETQIQQALRSGQPIEVLVRGKVVGRIDGLVRVSWAIKRSGDTWFAFPTKEGGAA